MPAERSREEWGGWGRREHEGQEKWNEKGAQNTVEAQ